MGLIDADRLQKQFDKKSTNPNYRVNMHNIKSIISHAPTVEAIPKDRITRAIDKVEEYICDVETDTVKAQGMAQALDIFEKALGEVEDGNDNGCNS